MALTLGPWYGAALNAVNRQTGTTPSAELEKLRRKPTPRPNTVPQPGQLVFPQQANYQQFLPGIQANLPPPPLANPTLQRAAPVQAPQLGPLSANAVRMADPVSAPNLGPAPTVQRAAAAQAPTLAPVQGIQGFDDSYYDNLYQQARQQLQKEYYEPGGLQSKAVENLNARGLLGSSIESGQQSRLGESFAEQLANVQSDLQRSRAEERIREAQAVRQLQQEQNIAGARMGTDVSLANVNREQGVNDLLANLTQTQALTGAKLGTDVALSNAERQQQAYDLLAKLRNERELTGAKLGTDVAMSNAEREQNANNQFAQLMAQVGMKRAELGQGAQELALRSALTQAGQANTFNLGEFEQAVESQGQGYERRSEREKMLGELLGNPNVELSPSQTDAIMQQLFGSAGRRPTRRSYDDYVYDENQRLNEIAPWTR